MSEKFTRDREATCTWDCTLDAGHDGPCGKKAAMTPADPALPQEPDAYRIADEFHLPVLFWLQQELRDACPNLSLAAGLDHGMTILRAELASLSARLQQVEQERDGVHARL